MSGSTQGAQVWRVEDGKEMATMEAECVNCLAVSKDARWIAAGTDLGEVTVWDWKTHEKVLTHWEDRSITAVDFSPDSTRLVIAADSKWSNRTDTTTVWDASITANVLDIAGGKRVVGPLRHEDAVRAAKYSPQGDRIATATAHSVRVYDSNDGRLLVNIAVRVTPWYNTGLLWSSSGRLSVISDSTIKQLDASTGSSLSEWTVPDGKFSSCIALPQHEQFIAHSANHTVTFWNTSTHAQLSLIQHTHDMRAIALSPDGRFLATCRESGGISIKRLSRITVSIVSSVVAYLNNSSALGLDPIDSSAPHFPRTGHSDRQHHTQFLEGQPTCRGASVIDCSNTSKSELSSPCTRLSSTRAGPSTTPGRITLRRHTGIFSLIPHILTLTPVYSPSKLNHLLLATSH